MINDESLRLKTYFYKVDSCVMNSYDSFRQKLIFDTNDRKKNWNLNWKWQMLISQKMKKKMIKNSNESWRKAKNRWNLLN